MRIISSCCTMDEVFHERVLSVEPIALRRKPFPKLDAIYLITPTKESIERLIDDFATSKKIYKRAHIYFTDRCSEKLMEMLKESVAQPHIKTLKEIDVAFLPLESKVFSLDCPEGHQVRQEATLERMAEQLSTVCSTL